MAVIVIILFTWRFEAFTRLHKHLYNLQSVIIMGPKAAGKTSFMKEMADESYRKGDFSIGQSGKIQFIDPHNFNVNKSSHLIKMNKFNNKSIVYMFDISPYSEPIKKQIKDYEKVKKTFDTIDHVIVANKVDIKDDKKLRRVKDNFDNVHTISITKGKGMNKLRNTFSNLSSKPFS